MIAPVPVHCFYITFTGFAGTQHLPCTEASFCITIHGTIVGVFLTPMILVKFGIALPQLETMLLPNRVPN